MSSNIPKSALGILHAREMDRKFLLNRYAPSEELGYFIKHYWIVSWELTGQQPYPQHVIPNPCFNMVVGRGRSGIYAPAKEKFTYVLEGEGCVFGIKFKPGGFYPFYRQPISLLKQRPLRISELFEVDDREVESSILSSANEAQMVERMEKLIRPKLPERDNQVREINQIIDWVIANKEITRVEDICSQFDIHIRKLQRLFEQYVGVSPKWVIQLYRLQNAAEMIDNGLAQGWLELCGNLGYYDQSHFIRDFKAVIGLTPDEYIRKRDVVG
jgi:AraC-like DNA-binding protein